MHYEFEGLDVTDLVMGFCEAMLFSDASSYDSSVFWGEEEQHRVTEGMADGSLPSDAGIADIEPDSMASIVNHCGKFARDHADILALALERTDAESIGRDLYYERAGHGVGFSDRDELRAGEDDTEEYEELTDKIRAANAKGDETTRMAFVSERRKLEEKGLAAQLSKAARGERGFGSVDCTAYQDDDAPSKFYVSVYLS